MKGRAIYDDPMLDKKNLGPMQRTSEGFSLPELLTYIAIFGVVASIIWSGLNAFYKKNYDITTLQNLTAETNFALRKIKPIIGKAQSAVLAKTSTDDEVDCIQLTEYETGTVSLLTLQESGSYYAFFESSETACDSFSIEAATALSSYIFEKRDTELAFFIIDDNAPNLIQFNLNATARNADGSTVSIPLNQGQLMVKVYE